MRTSQNLVPVPENSAVPSTSVYVCLGTANLMCHAQDLQDAVPKMLQCKRGFSCKEIHRCITCIMRQLTQTTRQ